MARKKHSDASIPATNTASPEDAAVPSQAVQAEAQDSPAVPATRRYRVSLPAQPARVVEAESAEDAYQVYKAMMGITGSVHKPEVVEAD